MDGPGSRSLCGQRAPAAQQRARKKERKTAAVVWSWTRRTRLSARPGHPTPPCRHGGPACRSTRPILQPWRQHVASPAAAPSKSETSRARCHPKSIQTLPLAGMQPARHAATPTAQVPSPGARPSPRPKPPRQGSAVHALCPMLSSPNVAASCHLTATPARIPHRRPPSAWCRDARRTGSFPLAPPRP